MNKLAISVVSLLIGICLSTLFFLFFWDFEGEWPKTAKCTEAFVQEGKSERDNIYSKPPQQVIDRMIVEAKNDANIKADRRCPSLCPPVFLLWEAHREYLSGIDTLFTKYVVTIRGSYQCLAPPVGDSEKDN